jgi:hypothetical protein
VQLAWPEALILRESRFAGFAMRKIAFDRTLELDYLLNRRQSALEGFDADYGKLVTVSFNLASIIHCLHDKRIAIVDLKPMNVKVYKAELFVSILDCDGFHIAADEFRSDAPQVTPEYLAPEFHDKAVAAPEAQDRFALATIIFRLLNFGIHPYAGVAADAASIRPNWPDASSRGSIPTASRPAAACARFRRACTKRFPTACVNCSTGHSRAAPLRGRVRTNGPKRSRSTRTGKTAIRCRFAIGGISIFRTTVSDLSARRADPRRQACAAAASSRGAGRARAHAQIPQENPAADTQLAVPSRARAGAVRGGAAAPAPSVSTRNAIALEILWISGLLITYWWTS